jgi:small nuclear ribonucleoprotein (snRNP)-like protein
MTGYKAVALHRTVIVNTTNGRSFRGALLSAKRDIITLGNAELLEPGQGSVPVPGIVVIERAQIDFVQVTG